MKVIWAPWRMSYIKSTVGNRKCRCFLCAMLKSRKDAENLVLKRGRTCAIVFNRYPYSSGHLMVAPRRHIAELGDLTARESAELMKLVNEAMQVLKKTLRPHGFNIGINIGEAAGAGLKDHIHVHIVPRWRGDTNFMPVFSETKVMPVSLEELWSQFRSALKPARGRG